jgi:8-oxo-dGTP pyrophosphatase MutT (NUDIX family)
MVDKKLKAGIVPFYFVGNDPHMMFMKPSDARYGGTKFQIAKGHIDRGENPLEAALRECNEELGLVESNIVWLEKCGEFFGNHHIYVALLRSDCPSKFEPFTDETSDVAWMNESVFVDSGRKKHRPVVQECVLKFNYCLKKRG